MSENYKLDSTYNPAFGKEYILNLFMYQHNCIDPKSKHMQLLTDLYRPASVLHCNKVFMERQWGENWWDATKGLFSADEGYWSGSSVSPGCLLSHVLAYCTIDFFHLAVSSGEFTIQTKTDGERWSWLSPRQPLWLCVIVLLFQPCHLSSYLLTLVCMHAVAFMCFVRHFLCADECTYTGTFHVICRCCTLSEKLSCMAVPCWLKLKVLTRPLAVSLYAKMKGRQESSGERLKEEERWLSKGGRDVLFCVWKVMKGCERVNTERWIKTMCVHKASMCRQGWWPRDEQWVWGGRGWERRRHPRSIC